MNYLGVWDNGKLIGIIMTRDIGKDFKPFAIYTVDELKNYEEFLNYNGIGTIRDDENNIVGLKSLYTGEINTPTSINSYTEINAPEIIMLINTK